MEKSGDKHKDILGEKQSHESFGVIEISRVSCTPSMNLFNSSIKHSNFIALRVKEATAHRSNGNTSVFGGREIVEVYMSATQFADMITNLNNGAGTPVTLQRVMGKQIEDCPVENVVMLHTEEFKERMQIFAERLIETKNEAIEIAKKKMNKKDADEWTKKINFLTQEIESNIPFFKEQFDKQMNKTVTEAKGEIEAFVQQRITEKGLEALYSNKNNILAIDKNTDHV